MKNPLTTPNFTPKNIVKSVQELTKIGLNASKKSQQGKDWDSVFKPLDKADFELGKQISINSHIDAVNFSEEFNIEYEKTLPILNTYSHKISTNKKLYKAFSNLNNSCIDEQKQYILANVLHDFELSGLKLNSSDAKSLENINEELSLLANKFSKNVLQSTKQWQKEVSVKDLGKNYPKQALDKISKDNKYIINLQAPIYLDVMTYAENEALREEVYNAYISRASDVGITDCKFDNKAIITKILTLRNAKAKLLDFDNYAKLSIAKKMVHSPEKVVDFLDNIIAKTHKIAKQELQELVNFAGKNLQAWDVAFYSEKLKNHKYKFKKEDLLPFFPEYKVLSGLFSVIERLYNIKVSIIDESSYSSDVKVLSITNNNNEIGKIYLDIYARENKRGGAWMSDYQGLYDDNIPIAFVVCNLNKPSNNKPALFDFDEVITLFHEFGHALHHLLTETKYPSVAGINGVPWDGVELPSQMMELFCYEREVIDLIAEHYQTKQKLSDELYQKLIMSKNFQSALFLLRQCELALWDIKVHLGNLDAYSVLAEVRKKTSLIPVIDNNRFLNSFNHIFGGGYASGYYSYLWAEVLASDAFLYIKSQGIFNQSVMNSFRKNILAVGGSLDFLAQYIKFRGKEPNVKSLLKIRNICDG